MRILLTGACGYIGRNLAPALKALGHEVIGLDRAANPPDCLDGFIRADLRDADAYRDALSQVDYIAHLAAAKGDWGISPDEFFQDNLEATRVLLDAARAAGVHRWAFYSTVAVLGPSDIPLDETAPPSPAIAYGASKAECERLFEDYCRAEPAADVVVIRPSAVYGAGNPWNTNIYRLIDAIYRRRFLMIGDGKEVKTTSYIENLIAANLFLMAHQLRHPAGRLDVYHYVDSPGETTDSLVDQVYTALGRQRPSWRLPLNLVAPVARVADIIADLTRIDLPITSARIRKFATGTNFDPGKIKALGFTQPVDNVEAIRRTVKWYLETEHSRADG